MKIYTSALLGALGLCQPALAGAAHFQSQPILAFDSAAVDARGINNDGAIAGSVTLAPGGGTMGFVLQGSFETALFGTCPGCTLYPTSINRTGVVAGSSGGAAGFVWQNGTLIANNLPLGQPISAQGWPLVLVNNAGAVAYTDNTPSGTTVYAGHPGHASAQHGLSAEHTVVTSFNRHGQLAGFEVATIQGQRTPAVFFGKDGFFNLLLTGGAFSAGLINDKGQVAFADLYAAHIYSNGATQTVSLPAQQGSISVQALNNHGRLAGTYLDTNQVKHVFYYNGTTLSTYGAYGGTDLVHVALNDHNIMLVSDRPMSMETVKSYRISCIGAGC